VELPPSSSSSDQEEESHCHVIPDWSHSLKSATTRDATLIAVHILSECSHRNEECLSFYQHGALRSMHGSGCLNMSNMSFLNGTADAKAI
jgi:hypothetical protein